MTGRRAGCTRPAPTASWPLGSARAARSSGECLELELRMFGEQTVGVWGALGEDDRRALVPLLAAPTGEPSAGDRGEHETAEPGGGER